VRTCSSNIDAPAPSFPDPHDGTALPGTEPCVEVRGGQDGRMPS
jgi:hypothetical protein